MINFYAIMFISKIKYTMKNSNGMRFCKIFILLSFSVIPSLSLGQVVINEIMYAPANGSAYEWIEIHNSGNESVDITDWRFFNGLDISAPLRLQKGSVTLSPNGYAIITTLGSFTANWTSFSGTVFTSSQFSLPDNSLKSSTYKAISDSNKKIINFVTYDTGLGGSKEFGNSLQKNVSSWVSGLPTPGTQNISSTNTSTGTNTEVSNTSSSQSSSSSNSTGSSNASSVSAHSSPAPLSDTTSKVTFEVSAGRERLSTTGNSIVFRAVATKSDGTSENNIFYDWSFGDGTRGQGKTVSHSYKFPGEYIIVLNARTGDLQAVSRTEVRVVSPQISLTKVSGGVEIHNQAKVEVNLEGWNISVDRKSFTIPADTIIPANKKIVFADSVTNLAGSKWELLNPLGQNFTIHEETKLIIIDTSTTSSDLKNDISALQTKLEETKRELARMIYVPQKRLVKVNEEIATVVSATTTPSQSQVANTFKVFTAEKNVGGVSRMFVLPLKGINWITRLFVEE